MGAGTFNKQTGKVRPGTYVNYETARQDLLKASERGTVLLPLTLNWGPVKEFITLTNGNPDGEFARLGYSVYEDDPNGSTLFIREIFKLASKVIFYRLTGGVAATASISGLSVTAKYPGTRGNAIRIVIESNPLGGMNIKAYLDTKLIHEQEGVSTIAELAENDFVVWGGDGATELSASAGTNLSGGTDTEKTNSDITQFLDDSEVIAFNTMCFPFEDTTLQTALKTKISYFRENVGKKVSAVAPLFEANYDGIISVCNGVLLADETKVDPVKACAWVSAADASAGNTTSNTYVEYDGATDVFNKKNNEQTIEAINKGQFVFSVVNNKVVAEYDINTLVDFTPPKSKDYRKNRVRRVLDTFDESLQLNFPPNKFANSPEGWDLMESLGKQIIISFRDAGAIKDVDLDNDFLVSRPESIGDETYINIGISPVDSAEKLYFTVRTR
ncbi:phage tail sheath family protein [Anaerovorax sp. IOR16]|uniref:phage tail sheath family protein n=1 Tax=Anaerovorax sp. IOR16 TaxID=2773458 RepID=UPI0019D0CA5B|nr:phage tail sheath family protein [Anaerovorax sp. IOR16]